MSSCCLCGSVVPARVVEALHSITYGDKENMRTQGFRRNRYE